MSIRRGTRSIAVSVALVVCAAATAAGTASCASSPSSRAVTIETAAVAGIHTVVEAEKAAYGAGAYGQDKHRQYLRALKAITDSESALNDALIVWANSTQADPPAVVRMAILNLQTIAADIQPLVDLSGNKADTPIGRLLTAIFSALGTMTPGGGGAEIDLTPTPTPATTAK